MKSTPAFLLCAALLIAALPTRADSVPYTGAASEFVNTENSAPEFRASATNLTTPTRLRVTSKSLSALAPVWGHEIAYLTPLPADAPNAALSATTFARSARRLDASQIDGQRSNPTSAIPSIGGLEPSSSFAGWGSEPSFIVDTMFSPSSDTSLHSSTITELGSDDPALSAFATEGARHKIGRERGRGSDGKNQNQNGSSSVEVPEPGALPLLLFGLVAVAIFARRHHLSRATT
jgi:hypothetical protein